MELTTLLTSGGILAGIGLIAGFWEKIKTFLLMTFSWAIVTVEINDYLVRRKFLHYMLSKYPASPFRVKHIDSEYIYFTNDNAYHQVIVDNMESQSFILWNKILPYWFSINKGEKDKPVYNSPLIFRYIRFTFNLNAILSEINQELEKESFIGSNDPRKVSGTNYSCLKVTGNIGSNKETIQTGETKQSKDSRLELLGTVYKPIDLKWLQIKDKEQALSNNVKTFYTYSSGAKDLKEEVERFLSSKQWHRNSGIPWKRGYILHGPPGTGKTSLVREIAKEYNLKVYSFDLASMTNVDLYSNWNERSFYPPMKIILIEDIDAIFHGRKNIVHEGNLLGKLTMDGLLNVLDGVDDSCNYLLFITTNDISKVDNAIGGTFDTTHTYSKESKLELSARPGRIDRALYMGNLNYEECLIMAKAIIGEKTDPSVIEQIVKDNHKSSTPSQFKEICFRKATEMRFNK